MRSAHFIGIAGIGMSATALLLKEAGWRVTGSDAESYGPTRALLERAHIPVTFGYRPENIPRGVDHFVIGRNAKLDPTDNAEVRAALASGIEVQSFPEVLAELTASRRNLVVAGSYGKSTTAALIAHLLRHAGVDAGWFIGAEPVRSAWLPAPAALGSAPFFILEGDEYPSAHDDERAKFLHLHPHDVLLTSVVHDHVNVYPTMVAYEKPFRELLALVPDDGLVAACADEPGAFGLAQTSGKRGISYGVQNQAADYHTGAIHPRERTAFEFFAHGQMLGILETSLLGEHNVQNIAGAAAWALARGGLSFGEVRAGIADFPGVRRRLDNIAPVSRVPVFEGFGSSYEKARAAIEAIRRRYAARPLVIVFEPHTFGWRNRANLRWYDDAFAGAEQVFVAAPAEQGAETHDQLSLQEIIERAGSTARAYEGPERVTAALGGDEVVLILTSGSLAGTLEELAAAIERRFAL